jgi:DNA-directed RNA polymerase specialized sigma24 family protein
MTSDKARSDPLLGPFLRAQDKDDREKHLIQLLEMEAAPVMQRVLRRKLPAGAEGSGNFEDVLSEARTELVRRLQSLREGTSEESIGNFRAYVSSVAYNAWAEHLRQAYPARSMLLNRLRYLLENRTKQQGFALWESATGERWCGLERHRSENPNPAMSKLQQLIVEPTKTAREAIGEMDIQTIGLAALLTRIFDWLEQPIELRHLVEVVADLLQISDQRQSLTVFTLDESEPRDLSPSPVEATEWQEYLRWLWEEIARLSPPQRMAFLLHSNVTIEFEVLGIASIRKLARALEISDEEMAQVWNRIPVDDLAIADLLGQPRQQVINLRRVARDRLRAAWEKWSK